MSKHEEISWAAPKRRALASFPKENAAECKTSAYHSAKLRHSKGRLGSTVEAHAVTRLMPSLTGIFDRHRFVPTGEIYADTWPVAATKCNSANKRCHHLHCSLPSFLILIFVYISRFITVLSSAFSSPASDDHSRHFCHVNIISAPMLMAIMAVSILRFGS